MFADVCCLEISRRSLGLLQVELPHMRRQTMVFKRDLSSG